MTALARAADMMSYACRRPLKRSVALTAGAMLAIVLSVIGFLFHGGGQNGARFAANLVLFSSSLVFALYYVAGPLSRLISVPATRALGEGRFALAYGFAGVMAVFIFLVLEPDYVSGARTPLPSLAYAALTAAVAAAFLMSAGSKGAARSVTLRSLQSLSCGYFWLVFVFTDMDRMAGPHRPDGIFYGLSLTLLAVAFLIRFADALIARRKAGMSSRTT
jgi:hypothetical protein